ncbi:A-kinase anchor protein 9 isoform X4 [Bufo gargarizans]|uniref:A-kinase anchor protein 9 isoform X4 n=1 Tax=Bufo gargarizans TaxID=30331 RepID=UPI001CF4ED82|nr:A-kinase anchor protein 9 isoform X4 [Bufo gargarizans]
MDEEEQERKRKLEAGKAKKSRLIRPGNIFPVFNSPILLAQFRQRKGQTDSQNTAKKSKKKKTSSSSKQRDNSELVSEAGLSQRDDVLSQTAPGGAATTAEFTIMRTLPQGEMIQHDKTYTIEPESEVSTTAEDYSSEVVDGGFPLLTSSSAHVLWEEEFGVRETYSEHGTQSSQARLEVMEDELAGKQHEIDELNRELEEMRAAYGTEGLQQLQEFETAIKQRDGIITQLTTNLQQARKEKDDIMREFLELTEQSQKLKIQFQHLQAGETLRNTSHSSTAADLLHSKQQILTYRQQLDDRDHHLSRCQKENEDLRTQVMSLQDQIHSLQQEQQRELESSYEQRLTEKDLVVDSLKSALHNEEIKCAELQERIYAAEKSVDELREQLTQKSLEINSLFEELNTSKQRERRSSDEIKQLMGTVEDLQKKHHKDNQSEADLVQRMESETQRKLEQLQAELDEMYGQQIVQMKQELVKQHTLEIEKLLERHRQELDNISSQTTTNVTSERINELNAVIRELNAKLLQSDEQKKKMREELAKTLEVVSSEKSHLQNQIEDLLQDLTFAREQIHKAKQSLTDKENKLNEANSFLTTVDSLKAELIAVKEFTKELESKHEAEVTNYKIKLEMLEREKDAVLGRMAESQEAELEKLRTYFLFSHEEELSKLREELNLEHKTNIENLKDKLEIQYKKQMDQMQRETTETITAMQAEKDCLVTKQNTLMLEISMLKDSPPFVHDPKSEEMMIQINELQKELECLRREEKEKGSIEQEVQVLQLRIEVLEKEVEDKDALKKKIAVLEVDNRLLKEENDALQNMKKDCNTENYENLSKVANLDLKNQIEVLSLENICLRNLELQLREEIEHQKNTFSFAEKNFEVNYHELKDKYTFLVKEKNQLEDSRSKLEEEFRLRFRALNDELANLKGAKIVESQVGPSKSIKADGLDVGEVVEKDTTELMEKLEIAQRDKHELSLKLSSLSEELQLKQNEINQLKEKVKSLGFKRDHGMFEDESCMKHKENVPKPVSNHVLVSNDGVDTHVLEESICPIETPHLHGSPEITYLQKEIQDVLMEKQSLLQRLHELTGKLEAETSLVESAQLEKDDLQRKVETVIQEQADLLLQLEAQRISLTQIHKAHLELIGESLRAEKEQELRSLRDSLLASQEQKIQELQELHQQELQKCQPQTEGETCQSLTDMLMKRIHKECHHINQVLESLIGEDTTEEAEILTSLTDSSALERHRTAMQTLHANLKSLLERFLKEYKQMRDLSSCMEKTGDLQASKEGTEIPVVTPIVIHSQNSAPSQSGTQEAVISPVSPSEDVERLKIEFSQHRAQLEEKHAREIEHLRSYFQQQLKEKEDRFSTELIHRQEKFQDVMAGSLESGELCTVEGVVELGFEEAAIFQSVITPSSDVLKSDDAAQMGDHSLHQSFGPIYQQLQTLRHALYVKYVEEVNALKKQHEAELDQLRAELTDGHNKEKAALKQEIIHLTNAKQEILNGSFQQPPLYPIPEEKDPDDINQLMEERFQEKIEEEVARVIVEMSIAFAQQTELARLASMKDRDLAEQRESSGEQREVPAEETDPDGEKLLDVKSPEPSPVPDHVDSADTPSSDPAEDLIAEQHGQAVDAASEDKTVLLREEDCSQMVAMGAESAKFSHLYEEKVEDMRQELVRQEQEYQQATEALRLAHAAQLERLMYDQEQLLSELHRLREQLAENASAMTENQATDREKMLLEELESMKQTYSEVAGRTGARPVQDSSSQTQPESKERGWEYEQGDGDRKAEEESHAGAHRKSLKRTNKHLLKILLEVVKTTGAVEETIGRHVVGLLDKSGRRQSTSKVHVWSPEPDDRDVVTPSAITVTASPDDGDVGVGVEGAALWSVASEEELDVALQFTEEGFSGADLSPDEEAQILNISTRLQAAVEKLLEAINDTSNQLAHAKVSQTELVRESIKRKQEATELLRCQEELQERLNEEAKAREHLALELSRAEGLLDGYTDERVFLEKQMQEKNDLIRHLEQELQNTGNRLQELEQERQQIDEEKELLSRQKLALKADATPAEQRLVEAAVVAAPEEELLEETEKLLQEKIEVQRQAEKDSGDLHKQVKVLEVELEEQVNRYKELEQEKNADLEDLRQKNLSLEKQLEKTRRFLDEQAVDREHERDVFQQEIQKLEQQMKMPQRHQPMNGHQSNEVEKLESNLKEKTDKCSELLLCKEQLQRDVHERNEEIEKLECRIRELEQALIISSDSLQKVEDRRPSIVVGLRGEMPLEAQLQVEREAIDRKEKEITNLVEQLEQFREELENKNEEVQQLHMQLEIQKKEAHTRLQEMEQENKVLKDEVENTQLEHPETLSSKLLHPKPGKTEELLLLKDQEIDHLNEQIGKLQAQLEAATDNKVIEEKNGQIKAYKSLIKCLKSDQEQLKKNSEEEIEKLNEVIDKLQEELSRIEQKVTVDFTDKHQYEDNMADKKGILQPVIGQGDASFMNMEEEDASKPLVNNMVVERENAFNTERRNEISAVSSKQLSEPLPEDMQATLQNMESKLKDMMDVIKSKDEQIIMLEKETLVIKDLKETIKKYQIELEDNKQKSTDMESSVSPKKLNLPKKTEGSNAEEMPLNKEMVVAKPEMQHVEELENNLESSENLVKKNRDDKVNTEKLTEELRERTAQYVAVEALLVSVQEASKDAIQRLEIQLQDLQTTLHEKESQLIKVTNASSLLENQEIERLNGVVEILQQKLTDAERMVKEAKESQRETLIESTEILRQEVDQDEGELARMKAELETTRKEMALLETELEKHRLLQRPIDVKNSEESKKIESRVEETSVTDLKQTGILWQKIDQDEGELARMKAELEKTRIEMVLLEKELENHKLLKSPIHVENIEESQKIKGSPVTEIEQTLSKKTMESSEETQVLTTSMDETIITTIKSMELQIQELQNVIHLKDAELLLYVNQKDLLDQQAKEIKQLKKVQEDLTKEKQEMSMYSDITTKEQVQKSPDGGDALQSELEDTKIENALLKEELEKFKNIKTKDVMSRAQHQDASIENEESVLQIEAGNTLTTTNDMELHVQQLQNIINLKDAELLQCEIQKDLLNQQEKEIEELKVVIRDFSKAEMKVTMDSGATTKDGESQTSHIPTVTENREVQKDHDDNNVVQAELEETKMEVTRLKKELEKQKEYKLHEDVKMEGDLKAEFNERAKEQAQRVKQTEPLVNQALWTSTEETTQNIIHNMESQLQELQNVVQQKDSELKQYLNQQNLVNQQSAEIERLHDVIESLNQQLGEAELKKSSIAKLESEDNEKELRQLMNGETTVSNSVDGKEDSRQLLRAKDNIDGQVSSQSKSTGDETHDVDGVEEALRDKTAQHLANQVLRTSVEEMMQNTIDLMESEVQEIQKVITEKDLEILLYLEEIETLRKQVKAESDQHGQMMLAMEDTLREKVAAALVSDAQLKAVQAHTRQLREVDRPGMMEEEAQIHISKSSMGEEADAKLSALSLRLLELEKQLSDLHEQLHVEREQVYIANQQAEEKQRQLQELQHVLETSRGNMYVNRAEGEPNTVDSALSQRRVKPPVGNTVTDLENMLQSIKEEATATKEELCHYREVVEKLKEELMVKESNLAHLEEDLREVKKCLAHAEQKLAFYMKKELQEEEEQAMSGGDFSDSVRSPGWTTRDRSTSSSSQTDIVPSVNNGNQTSRVRHKHIGVQKELAFARLSHPSEEVAEIMERYTDKIGQMQDLHAAEILDMEARHISEADTLRREQYAVVQALTNECEALKAVIEALKSSGGAVPDSALSPSYHLTDAAFSDCDWSQGTCDAQSIDQLQEGLRVEDEIPEEFIPSKIKDLLRAVHQEGMQVLSLTEATSPEKEKPFTIKTQPWREERKTLIDTIASLKDLIAKMQIFKEPEVHAGPDFHERSPDWRGELLRAIQEVFCREQDVLLSAFHTQLSALSNCDATALVNQMQHQLQEQGMEHINAMDCIQNAERRSLLLEIQDLRAQLTSLHIDPNIDSFHHTEGAAVYMPQDSSSLHQEMHVQLNSMKAIAKVLQEQLGSERLLSAEFKNELARTKMELESTLKLQQKHFKELESLRMQLKTRRDELDSVNDALANEQRKTRELQWALEKEKTKAECHEQQEKEELEDLRFLFEAQKTKTVEISKHLEEERLLVKSLQEQLASKESLHEAALSQERSKVSELQVFLAAERTRSSELSSALQCKQGLEARLQTAEATGLSEAHNPTEELLRDLQGQLDSKHNRMIELATEAERYKLESVQLRQHLEQERQKLLKELEAEKEAAKLKEKQAEKLKSMVEELQQQIKGKEVEIRRLQTEEKHLKETIKNLQKSERTQKSDSDRAELSESCATDETSADPARSEIYPPTGSVPNVLCPDPFSTVNGDPSAEGAAFSIDSIRRRLQQVSAKLKQLEAKATRRATFEATDDNDFAWSQNAIQEVVSQLERVSMLSLQGQNLVLPPGISANTLTDKLLTQNAELTGYVSRLTNEKNDLQNTLLRLEREISYHRAREGSADHSTWGHATNISSFTEEREAWTREKLNLHKSLKKTEAELSKVKAELRNETIQRDLGRDTDNAALKRVYGKYLRSESFRKALVYQKKYLLLLLGGFQECEEATLALIARMGGQPTNTDLEVITKHSRAFTRFRSAVRVAIAISRMKFLVRRWQRPISPIAGTANRNGFGQIAGYEARTDSPYHPAGSVDMYGDQRLSSCRSRSGFDSPQSTVNSQHRYASSDLSTCSPLQNYDPDRALTDYIARLEALQKRLGSTPSAGSTAHSTTHYSIRR